MTLPAIMHKGGQTTNFNIDKLKDHYYVSQNGAIIPATFPTRQDAKAYIADYIKQLEKWGWIYES